MSNFLIYKSSAGSGKTTALIQIFLKLSLVTNNPNQFKRLLAITFTNKAADEMKERFILELDKLSSLDANYSEGDFMVDWLLAELKVDVKTLKERASNTFQIALQDYNDIGISTIDRFNHRLVRSFSRDLDIKQDFEVLVNTGPLYRDAVQLMIEKFGRNDKVTKHLLAYMRFKFDEAEKVNIANSLMELEKLVISDESNAAIKQLEGVDFDAVEKSLKAQKKNLGAKCRQLGSDLLNLCSEAGLGLEDFSGKKSGVVSFYQKLSKFPEDDLKKIPASVSKALKGNWLVAKPDADIATRLNTILPELEKKTAEALTFVETRLQPYWLSDAILKNLHLIAVLEELSVCIEEICEDKNYLPLYKFNAIISEMLRDEPVAFMYEHIGARYAHILIDEYQDTSRLQWFNLLPLIEESLAQGNTSLVVGDAKQSIYRFRGGKAEQLISLPILMDPPENLDMQVQATLARTYKIVKLNSNYRSWSQIVDFNNRLFSAIGKTNETSNALHQMEYEADNVSQKIALKGERGLVKIKCWSKSQNDDEPVDYIFEQIEACTALGYSYGDMAILVRSANHGAAIIKKLIEANIAVSTAESLELDKNVHIRLLIALLRINVDKGSNLGKIGAMRSFSSILSFEFDPTKYASRKNLDFELYLKDHNLPAFKFLDKSLGIFDTVQTFIHSYLPNVSDPYLDGLFEEIINNIGSNGTVNEFLTWWDGLSKKPSLTSENSPNAVKVMTIHKSKGLQFKLVFMPRANWDLSSRTPGYRWFNLEQHPNAAVPFAPLPVSENLTNMGLVAEWEKEEDDQQFDNFNLLYVALTRAEHGLFISYHKKSKGSGKWISEAVDQMKLNYFNSVEKYNLIEGKEGEVEITLGELAEYESPENNKSDLVIAQAAPTTSPWTERIQVVNKEQSADQKIGVLFHQVIATSKTKDVAQEAISRMRQRYLISAAEFENLRTMAEQLYADDRFQSLLGAEGMYKERDLLLNGEVLRPDMLVDQDESMTIIDFKTGDENEKHHEQVRRYMIAASQLSDKPVWGYLLYISDKVVWTEVAPNTEYQPSLFD